MTALDTHNARISTATAAWVLSAALVALTLIAAAIALLWPTSAFGEAWTSLLGQDDSILRLLQIIAGCIVVAWLITIVFAAVFAALYNRWVSHSQH